MPCGSDICTYPKVAHIIRTQVTPLDLPLPDLVAHANAIYDSFSDAAPASHYECTPSDNTCDDEQHSDTPSDNASGDEQRSTAPDALAADSDHEPDDANAVHDCGDNASSDLDPSDSDIERELSRWCDTGCRSGDDASDTRELDRWYDDGCPSDNDSASDRRELDRWYDDGCPSDNELSPTDSDLEREFGQWCDDGCPSDDAQSYYDVADAHTQTNDAAHAPRSTH
jgi:hypothetical protein